MKFPKQLEMKILLLFIYYFGLVTSQMISACSVDNMMNCPLAGYLMYLGPNDILANRDTGSTALFDGIPMADRICERASGINGSKALLADKNGCFNKTSGAAVPCRRATVTSYKGDFQIDWPLLPNSRYNSWSNKNAVWGVTNSNSLFDLGKVNNNYFPCANQASGMFNDWTTDYSNNCCNWHPTACNSGSVGRVGWSCNQFSVKGYENFNLNGGTIDCGGIRFSTSFICVVPAPPATTTLVIKSTTDAPTSTLASTLVPSTTKAGTTTSIPGVTQTSPITGTIVSTSTYSLSTSTTSLTISTSSPSTRAWSSTRLPSSSAPITFSTTAEVPTTIFAGTNNPITCLSRPPRVAPDVVCLCVSGIWECKIPI